MIDNIVAIMGVRFPGKLPTNLRERLEKYSPDELDNITVRAAAVASAEDALAIPPSESPSLAPQ